MPSSFTISNSLGSTTNAYVYSADGRKLKVTKGTFTTDYVGNVIYENNVLKRILVDGGYYENGTYYFYLIDHLGNNRVVANQSGSVVQSTQYYPFADGTNPSTQPYKFGGKELDSDRGLNLYDFHARWQDAALGGRFLSVDPLAEKYYSVSPYVYCMNNPVRFVDPDGREVQIPPTALPLPIMPPPPYVIKKPANTPSAGDVLEDATDAVGKRIKFFKAFTILNSLIVYNEISKLSTDNASDRSGTKGEMNEKKVNPKREAKEKGKEKREAQPASDKRAKDLGKKLEREKGKDARRNAHDSKDKGSGDRTKKQLLEDYDPNNH